jgi:signal transduction histidine kinase
MPFRVTARTILQLGAELISSDAVAFYELIKNAFDAGSPRVWIRIVCRIPHEHLADAREALLAALNHEKKSVREAALVRWREHLAQHTDLTAPDAKPFKQQVTKTDSLSELIELGEQANYIEFEDKGEGMSLRDLDEVYLTIGTRSRQKQRQERARRFEVDEKTNEQVKPILGEKGLGRLSTMRLGRRLHIESSKKGESKLSVLDIDWTRFSHNSDELLETVPVTPQRGPAKKDRDSSGTLIRISGLESDWSEDKLEDVARDEFSKLSDPFTTGGYPVSLRYNGDVVPIPKINELLFEHAHATVASRFVAGDSGPRLSGKVTYRDREKVFELEAAHLLSAAEVLSLRPLQSLGPFTVQAYWFNRRILTAIEGIGELRQVRQLVALWAGGLMLYRDGFRVYPYGGPDDDWLALDPTALAVGGYKVNRRQIIGKVDISSLRNPRLVDQTNREGLRRCAESDALVNLLRHILMSELKPFLDAVDAEVRATDTVRFDEIERRFETQEDQIERNIELLLNRHPKARGESDVLRAIEEALGALRDLMNKASQLAKAFDKGRSQLVHLAGLGLMVESVAHELGRATTHTLATLAGADTTDLTPTLEGLLNSLEAQLTTLQKRLRMLDPLSTAARQTKERFDVVEWLNQTLAAHDAQFRRHGIDCSLAVTPKNSTLEIRAVKGMVIQIIENLISNSVYWLKQQRKLDRTFKPTITVKVFTKSKQIHFTDNGPGVQPARREEIFEPFVTTKPPGEGKGLGLFVSREIAAYHGASLYLSDENTGRSGALNTFVLALESGK